MEKRDSKEDKIKQICESLRKETLEPAKLEAQGVVDEAKEKAAQIIAEAEAQAERLLLNARKAIEQERHVFHSSLEQAARQSLESLRQSIEEKLFNEEVEVLIREAGSKPHVISDLIKAIVHAIEKEGLDVDLQAVIPKSVSPEAVSGLLGEHVMKRLQGNALTVGSFHGGVQIKLVDKKLTIDITDSTIKELISDYARKDFRKMIFAN